MSSPRISIGMPVRDGLPYIEGALASLLAQTFDDFELIISDNASSDGTEEVCREFARRDSRVAYVRQPENLGAAHNFNYLARVARGELFKWAPADDEAAPEFLADCVAALDSAGDEALLAFPRTRWIGAAGERIEDYGAGLPWTDGPPHERLACLLADPVHSHLFKCSAIIGLVRRAALLETGLIRPHGGSDRVCLVELALRGRWVEVPEPHYRRRIHGGTSLVVNKSPEAVARWFDPSAGTRFPMPRVRLFKGYLAAIRSAPLPLAERARCLGPLSGLLRQEWRVLGGEYKIALRQALAR